MFFSIVYAITCYLVSCLNCDCYDFMIARRNVYRNHTIAYMSIQDKISYMKKEFFPFTIIHVFRQIITAVFFITQPPLLIIN